MEQSEIISSIITAIATLLVAGSAFFVGRYNSKTNKTSTILEEQYLKVISPIHYILKMTKREKIYSEINDVIADNYHLLPDGLYDDFMNFVNEKIDKYEFEKKIDEFNRILRYKLGYSKIRLTKDEKEAAKRLAKFKDGMSTLFDILMIIVGIIAFMLSLHEDRLLLYLNTLF